MTINTSYVVNNYYLSAMSNVYKHINLSSWWLLQLRTSYKPCSKQFRKAILYMDGESFVPPVCTERKLIRGGQTSYHLVSFLRHLWNRSGSMLRDKPKYYVAHKLLLLFFRKHHPCVAFCCCIRDSDSISTQRVSADLQASRMSRRALWQPNRVQMYTTSNARLRMRRTIWR